MSQTQGIAGKRMRFRGRRRAVRAVMLQTAGSARPPAFYGFLPALMQEVWLHLVGQGEKKRPIPSLLTSLGN